MNPSGPPAQGAGGPVDVAELVRRLAPALLPVPAPGGIVCPRCRSSKGTGFRLCRPCALHEQALGGFGIDVLPISLSEDGQRLHDHLNQYKYSRDAMARYQFATALGGLIATFVSRHQACLGEWDTVVTVPSKKHPHPHPLYELVGRITLLRDQLANPISANPSWTGGSRQAGRDRFMLISPAGVRGRRVLLIDDTFTTGSSFQSAALSVRVT